MGIICILLCCWGVDSLISLSSVSFPASVALLITLFLALILSQTIIGDKKTKVFVSFFDVPVSWVRPLYHGRYFAYTYPGWLRPAMDQCLLHAVLWYVDCK